MTWPPQVGEPLPHAADAIGIKAKLAGYSLDPTHRVGGPKALGFELILGITLRELDHLESEIRAGILIAPVAEIRDNSPHGINCVVTVRVHGTGPKGSGRSPRERSGR